MAESEKLEQLDRRIAETVLSALSGLRDEISQRLREHTDSIEGKLQALEEILPASFLADADLEPLTHRAASDAREQAFAEVRDAMVAIDHSTSQAGILGALLEGSAGFCSRAALLLTRADAVQGWGGNGFAADAPEVSELRFDYDGSSPWSRLLAAHSSLELSPAESAPLCSQLESAVPSEALLIPLILADRLAAVLYVDRLSEEDRFDTAALQSLVFVAAQAIEILPFRERAATATLASDGVGATGGAALLLWGEEDAEAVSGAEPSEEVEEAEEAEASAGLPSEDLPSEEEASAAAVTTPALSDQPEPVVELEPEEEAWTPPKRAQETEELSLAELERLRAEAEEEERRQQEDEAETGDEATGDEATGAIQALSSIDEDDDAAPETFAARRSALSLDAGLVTEEIAITPRDSQDEVAFDVSAAFDEPATSELSAVDEELTAELPAIDVSEDETVLIPRPGRGDEPMAPQPPISTVPPPAAGSSPSKVPGRAPSRSSEDSLSGTAAGYLSGPALVEPPAGIDGPGSAFRDFSPGMSKAEEAAHEEGRRLARLLVSEIRLYYEDQVEEGRRNRDIYRRLKEDIDRSRKMYEERIDDQVRDSRDYFKEELVRILADGDEGALGL